MKQLLYKMRIMLKLVIVDLLNPFIVMGDQTCLGACYTNLAKPIIKKCASDLMQKWYGGSNVM